jgi:HAD superfamily hydrolase (TIGR01484 family)
MNCLFLFDVDGTIAESGQKMDTNISLLINKLQDAGNEIGIVGGGKIEKILEQIDNKCVFDHYFAECGCVYFKSTNKSTNNLTEVYKKNIRAHTTYDKINILVKLALKFLSEVDYTITGNFIDLRNGIIYISLIGLVATQEERAVYMDLDKKFQYRKQLLHLLHEKAFELNIHNCVDIVEGGSVGIAIYPKEYDKIQVLSYFPEETYKNIYYFGDKYEINGNDYKIISNERVFGMRVDSLKNTVELLNKISTFIHI